MLDKLRAFLANREQKKSKRKIIKFLENVKKSKRGVFNYKIADTYFHLYVKGRTYSLNSINLYDVDQIIDIVCYQIFNNRMRINKEFFKGLKWKH